VDFESIIARILSMAIDHNMSAGKCCEQVESNNITEWLANSVSFLHIINTTGILGKGNNLKEASP